MGPFAANIALAMLLLGAPCVRAGGPHDVPLPPMESIDDLAWTPLPGDRLLITPDGETTLQVLDSRGKSRGTMYFPLPHIRDVKALRDGTLVLGDRRTGRIYHVKAEGPLLGSAGSRGLSAGQFLQLDRVDADAQGRLYGLDGAELKVLQFTDKGELLGSFPVETGPVIDNQSRLIEVRDLPSAGVRRILAFETAAKSSVVHESKLEPETRWEPMAALSDGSILIRVFDSSGKCSIQRVGAEGKIGDTIKLAEDAILAGPVRVLGVDPDETCFYYLAGASGHYRAVRVPVRK